MNDGGHFGHVPNSTTEWINGGKIAAAVIGYTAFLFGTLVLLLVVIVFSYKRYQINSRRLAEQRYYEEEEDDEETAQAAPMEP